MSNYDPSRNDERYRLTDTGHREQSEELRKELEQQVAAFIAKGGKITEVPSGQILYRDLPFKIKTEKAKAKQQWKEESL